MKLSEAIRLGALATPRGEGSNSMQGDARCALGAALHAAGLKVESTRPSGEYDALWKEWPWLYETLGHGCPECRGVANLYMGTIWHLNDTHHWPRERIADWVAGVEPQDTRRSAEPAEFDEAHSA